MDEAGRGPWAGPVFCSSVIFPGKCPVKGLNDSKLISAKKRDYLFDKIIEKTFYGIGYAEYNEIDGLGLIKAVELAFKRAIDNMLSRFAQNIEKDIFLLIDGRDKFNFDFPYKTIIKGDQKIKEISAASILAKVSRDRFMDKISLEYPQYGFDKHKGYGTKLHMKMIEKYGICKIHRRSFKPIRLVSSR